MKVDPEIKAELKEYLTHNKVKNKEVLKKYLEKRMSQKKRKLCIISSYKLTNQEIDLIMQQFPFLPKRSENIVNEVDAQIMAGVVIKFGSKVIDLTLESHLKSLKNILNQ